MAAIRGRRRSDGTTGYTVAWRLGGTRAGAQQSETFDDPAAAAAFRDAVEKAEQTELERQLKEATAAFAAVRAFLDRVGQSDEPELDVAEARAQQELAASTSRLTALRSGVQAAVGGPADLRATVSRLRLAVSDAEAELTAARASIDRGCALLAQLVLDQERLQRADRATRSLSGLEFSVCPRCLQAVDSRDLPENICLLCTQHQPRTTEADAANHASLQRLEVSSNGTQPTSLRRLWTTLRSSHAKPSRRGTASARSSEHATSGTACTSRSSLSNASRSRSRRTRWRSRKRLP